MVAAQCTAHTDSVDKVGLAVSHSFGVVTKWVPVVHNGIFTVNNRLCLM